MKFLIFANGKKKDGTMVRRAIADSKQAHIIAADGGAKVAWYYQLQAHTVIGDMDSLTRAELQQLEAAGAELIHYPAEKNETDLELALLLAAQRGATWIRIIGGIGGRFDQMLANVYLLTLSQLHEIDVSLVAEEQEIYILRAGQHHIQGDKGDTISLIPVSGDVSGIRTKGLKYALKNDTLSFGPARGISNVMEEEQVEIRIDDGLLLCIHTKGRA